MDFIKIIGITIKNFLAQGNMDYSLFDALNLQPRGYIDITFGNRIFVKGNLFLCYVLIFTFVGFMVYKGNLNWILFVYGI